MNFTKKLISTAVAAGFALAAPCAFGAESSVRLQVPFAFVVAGRTMPAGDYTIDASGSVVSVRGAGSSVLVAGGPETMTSNEQPGLVFARRGGRSYLVGVRTEEGALSIGSGAR